MFLNESRCRVAEKCLSRFYFTYLHRGHGIGTRRPAKPLIIGNLHHGGLAAHYLEGPIRDGIVASLEEQFPNFQDLDYAVKNEWLEEADWVEKVMARYIPWAATEDNFTVVGVEQSGSVVLGESCWQCGAPYPAGDSEWMLTKGTRAPSCPTCFSEAHHFVFRLDLLIRDDYGYAVLDHKTTASGVDDWYLKTWDHSSQLWGYCYGAQKMSGHKIGRYYINIIRKVKSAGVEPDRTKSCPGCGRKKNKGCVQCSEEPTPGRIPRPPKPSDIPFVRADFSFDENRAKWFVDSRVRLANKLTEHTRRLEEGDPTAFPHNPSSIGCDPDLCLGRFPGQSFAERFVDEERYYIKGPDYVTEKRLAFEEGL